MHLNKRPTEPNFQMCWRTREGRQLRDWDKGLRCVERRGLGQWRRLGSHLWSRNIIKGGICMRHKVRASISGDSQLTGAVLQARMGSLLLWQTLPEPAAWWQLNPGSPFLMLSPITTFHHHSGFATGDFLNSPLKNYRPCPECHVLRVTPMGRGTDQETRAQGKATCLILGQMVQWSPWQLITETSQSQGPGKAFALLVPEGGKDLPRPPHRLQPPTSARCCSSSLTFFSAAPRAPTSGVLPVVTPAWGGTEGPSAGPQAALLSPTQCSSKATHPWDPAPGLLPLYPLTHQSQP